MGVGVLARHKWRTPALIGLSLYRVITQPILKDQYFNSNLKMFVSTEYFQIDPIFKVGLDFPRYCP